MPADNPSKPDRTSGRFPTQFLVPASLLYFCVAGFLVIPYLGFENDEALFANAIYAPQRMPGQVELFGFTVPLMVMPYVGALKSWIYALIFWIWSPTVWSVRLPALAGAALTIWLFHRLLYRAAGRAAAITGCVLLATDAAFLVTTAFDRGPVVPQLLLLTAGLLLATRFYQRRQEAALAAAFFVFGLGLWDKAVLLWLLSAAVVAAGVVFHREIRAELSLKRCAIAGAAFLAGSLPFWIYNVSSGGATFQGREFSTELMAQKIEVMKATAAGNVLIPYLIDWESPAVERDTVTAVEAGALSLSSPEQPSRVGLLPAGIVLAALLAPLAWRRPERRALLFFLIAYFVAWAQMLITVQAGGGSHHTILLWPYLIGFVAVSLTAAARRLGKRWMVALGLAVALIGGSDIRVTNEYLAGMIRRGPGRLWTDAVFPLRDSIKSIRPSMIYAADWGMDYSLQMLLEGDPPIAEAINLFPRPELSETERTYMRARLSRPDAVFLAYVDGKGVFPDGKRLVRQCAEEEGYEWKLLREIADGRGRPVFELYRFAKLPDPVDAVPTGSSDR